MGKCPQFMFNKNVYFTIYWSFGHNHSAEFRRPFRVYHTFQWCTSGNKCVFVATEGLTENLTAPSQRASLFHQSPAPATNHSAFKEDTHTVFLTLFLFISLPIFLF